MSRSSFKVTCLQCRAAFSTPFPQETASLRCPECFREAPGREFEYAPPAGKPASDEGVETAFAPVATGAFERRGKWILFQCPHCQWAMRIGESLSAGSLVDCARCGLEILPPNPGTGTPAKLTRAGALRLERMTSGVKPSSRGTETGAAATRYAGSAGASASNVAEAWQGAVRTFSERIPGRNLRDPGAGGAETEIARGVESPVPKHEERLLRQARIFRFLMIGGIAVLAVLGLLARFHAGGATETRESASTQPVPRDLPDLDPVVEEAKVLGAEMVAQKDWRRMLAHVRQRDRVEPIMADYYARHPFAATHLVAFDAPISMWVSGRRYLQFSAVAAGGERRIVGFERAENGKLAFDWEVYEDVAADQWKTFRTERPTLPRALRFAFMRASVPGEYFRDAAIPEGEGMAVRIWLRDRADSLVAVLPKDSLAGTMIDRLGSWEVGKLVVGELAFPPGSALPDRVRFEHLLQERWLIMDGKGEPLF